MQGLFKPNVHVPAALLVKKLEQKLLIAVNGLTPAEEFAKVKQSLECYLLSARFNFCINTL